MNILAALLLLLNVLFVEYQTSLRATLTSDTNNTLPSPPPTNSTTPTSPTPVPSSPTPVPSSPTPTTPTTVNTTNNTSPSPSSTNSTTPTSPTPVPSSPTPITPTTVNTTNNTSPSPSPTNSTTPTSPTPVPSSPTPITPTTVNTTNNTSPSPSSTNSTTPTSPTPVPSSPTPVPSSPTPVPSSPIPVPSSPTPTTPTTVNTTNNTSPSPSSTNSTTPTSPTPVPSSPTSTTPISSVPTIITSSTSSPIVSPSFTYVQSSSASVPSFLVNATFSTPLQPYTSPPNFAIQPGAQSPTNNTSITTVQVIVGVSSAVSVLFVATFIFFVVFLRKKRKKSKREKHRAESPSEGQKKSLETLTIQDGTQPATTDQRTDLMRPTNPSDAVPVALSSLLKHSQISFTELTVERKIGRGSYGKVCLGKWNAAPVALKFCRKKEGLEDFVREIRVMVELPSHPNVVQLLGVSLDGPQPIIVLEYCAGGSLDKLLFQENANISVEYKMRLVRGIAAGMFHLHKHNIVHRDLAARNILLTSGGDPKISDFGMSRILEKEDEGKTNSTVGPVCWMAPESIAHRNYSKKSDVWTFGIVVYEIVAQCEPHKDQDLFQIGVRIRDEGLTPKIPSNCPQKLHELMQMCWKLQPEQRPNFETICVMLQQ